MKREIILEFPAGINQQDLWNLENELRQTEGIAKANLEEPKDFLTATILVIGLVPEAARYVKTGMETFVNIQAAAKKLHEFLHPKDPKSNESLRKRVTLKLPDGTQTEFYGYSVEEIETLLTKALSEEKQLNMKEFLNVSKN